MAASYPTSAKSFSTKATTDTVEASHVNDIQDEVTAIEAALLTTGLAHNVFPSTSGARDLGTSALKWRDFYLSRNATIGGTLVVTGNTTFSGITTIGSDITLTDSSGTLIVRDGAAVNPANITVAIAAASALKTTTALNTATDGGSTAAFTANMAGSTGGPTTAAQNGWVKMQDSAGATIWVPVWK